MAHQQYVEQLAQYIPLSYGDESSAATRLWLFGSAPTLEPTESVTFFPFILSTLSPSVSVSSQFVERIDWSKVITISATTSIVTTICVLGASSACGLIRAYLRHKYLNGIYDSSDSSDSSQSSREDAPSESESESEKSSVGGPSSQLERFIWAHFTFDKIYARDDDDSIV